MNKNIIKFSLVAVIVLGAVILTLFLNRPANETGGVYTINLTVDGFQPDTITINKGETVKFTTSAGKQFWPASDLHPTHLLYPEFDPKEPVQPDKSWSFKFDKVGEWRFHDHLFPYFRGTIKVIGNKKTSYNKALYNCRGLKDNLGIQCWDDNFRSVLKNKGLSAAYDLLADLYKNNPDFASQCHVITHTIGEAAYQEFKYKKEFAVSDKTSYCGFGFFHGFMEALFADGNGPDMAREVCNYMDKQLKEQLGRAGLACFHGIGHGAADGSALNAWGNEQVFVQPALDLCDKIAQTDNEKYRCASGAFNSLSIAYVGGQYGMKLNKEDPLWICRKQKKEYQKGCYSDMMVAIVKLADHNIVKGADYLKNVENLYAKMSVRSVSGLVVNVRLQDTDYSDVVSSCQKIESRLRDDCIGGFGNALMEFGEPGNDYVKAIAFCGLKGMTESEKRNCFESVLGYAMGEYKPEKMQKICLMVDKRYWGPNCGV